MLANANSQTQRSYFQDGDAAGKRALLTGALELFTLKGIDATTIRDIGEAAGLTNPAMFRHFSGKDELAQYLFERIYRRLRSTLPRIDSRPFAVQLRSTLDSYVAFIDDDLHAALYFQENLRRFFPALPDSLRRRSMLAHLRALLQAGIAQGVVSADEDLRLLTALLAGILGQLPRQLFFNEISPPASSWLDPVQRLLLRSLAPASKRRARRPQR